MAIQGFRPIVQIRQDKVGNLPIVANQISLGVAVLRPVHLIEVGEGHGMPADFLNAWGSVDWRRIDDRGFRRLSILDLRSSILDLRSSILDLRSSILDLRGDADICRTYRPFP